MRFENKVAIVTGAASGIGRATAKRFAAEGGKVVLADFNDVRLAEAVEEIRAAGGVCESIHTDVRVLEDNERMFAFTLEKFGKYDVLVCNAGMIDGFTSLDHFTDESWDKVIDTDLTGPMQQARIAVQYFAEQGGGVIVNVSSNACHGGGRAGAAYAVAKRGLEALTQHIAAYYWKKGIRCNAVAPGAVATNIMDTSLPVDQENMEYGRQFVKMMTRMMTPEELAAAILFLASDDAGGINGAIVNCDAAWDAQ